MKDFKEQVAELEKLIVDSYEIGVTTQQAQDYAARFLVAQLAVSTELRKLDLDARMRKTGVKATRAAVYLDECRRNDKKPSDVLLGATVDSSPLVTGEQQRFDEAEADKDEMERIYSVFQSAHVHFRNIAKVSSF
jgi:hypothetical protein